MSRGASRFSVLLSGIAILVLAQVAGVSAQPPTNAITTFLPSSFWAGTAGGDLYMSPGGHGAWTPLGNVFGGSGASSPLVALYSTSYGSYGIRAACANGDIYEWQYPSGSWLPSGNVFGGASPVSVLTVISHGYDEEAVTAGGDLYVRYGDSGTQLWSYVGNILGNPPGSQPPTNPITTYLPGSFGLSGDWVGTANGDVYARQGDPAAGTLLGNVFGASGAGSPLVALYPPYYGHHGPRAASANGDIYEWQADNPSGPWQAKGNVFGGALPGVSILTVAGWVGGHSDWALTAGGDVYEWGSDTAPWSYVGNIFGNAPVPTLHSTWGQLKARYR